MRYYLRQSADNVVRAGLTPKLRDVPTLVSMLTYTWGPSSTQLMKPESYPKGASSSHTTLYNPPIEEFSVLLTNLLEKGDEAKLPAVEGPSIFIVTEIAEGQTGTLTFGKESVNLVREGQTFFVAAGTELVIKGKLVAYTAFVEAPERSRL